MALTEKQDVKTETFRAVASRGVALILPPGYKTLHGINGVFTTSKCDTLCVVLPGGPSEVHPNHLLSVCVSDGVHGAAAGQLLGPLRQRPAEVPLNVPGSSLAVAFSAKPRNGGQLSSVTMDTGKDNSNHE
ncbi:hypothetical protein Bbelb_174940 [Branchiostoma belcheri]|nr:hypothetical protein Bbelb_174940 [Branchiostoma belcheri]